MWMKEWSRACTATLQLVGYCTLRVSPALIWLVCQHCILQAAAVQGRPSTIPLSYTSNFLSIPRQSIQEPNTTLQPLLRPPEMLVFATIRGTKYWSQMRATCREARVGN